MISYLAILATMMLGALGAPWPIILAGAILIAVANLADQQKIYSRFVAVGAVDMIVFSGLTSLAMSSIAAVAAFALGRLLGAWA